MKEKELDRKSGREKDREKGGQREIDIRGEQRGKERKIERGRVRDKKVYRDEGTLTEEEGSIHLPPSLGQLVFLS